MSTIQNGKVVLGVDTLLKTKNGAAVKTGLSKRHNLTGKQLCTACVVGLFVATGAASVGAQTWTNVSLDNNWGTATNWSTNTVPNSATATVTIGSPATIASPVQDNVSVTVLSLTLNSGSGLVIDNGTHSTIGNGTTGTLANSGVITIDDAGNGTQLNISGAVTLNGDGTINLGQTSSVSNTNNGMSGSGTLTNVNNIIQGYNNYGWTLGGNSIGIVNQTGGKIIANTSGQSLWVDPNSASGVVNTGLMEATNGGNLVLDGNGGGAFVNTDGTNSGTISAVGTGSTVTLTGGAALSNGTLSSSGGGAFYADSGSLANLTNAATFNIDNSATVTLIGTINNTGTINVNDAGNGTRLIIDSAGVTLKGGGTINLGVQPAANTNNAIGSNNTVSVFTNINNTIQGYNNISYTLGSNNLDIVNQASGTIDANTVGQQLWVDPSADKGMVNAGLMEATKGGNLVLTGNGGGAFNNTGGTILATGSGTAGSNT
ncbi:MAG: hypothetical protein HKL96_06940, partial [Phycisphaerales bacterium]|nr:hypothetical protein [Phycisphaerales bacterium]